MIRELTVELTQDRDCRPLATVVRGLPGEGADMSPAELRALAAALLAAAADCEARPMDKKHFMRRVERYDGKRAAGD